MNTQLFELVIKQFTDHPETFEPLSSVMGISGNNADGNIAAWGVYLETGHAWSIDPDFSAAKAFDIPLHEGEEMFHFERAKLGEYAEAAMKLDRGIALMNTCDDEAQERKSFRDCADAAIDAMRICMRNCEGKRFKG